MEQSKKISRKVIGALLSLLMVLSCFSGLSLTAYAAPTCPNPGCRSTNVEPLGDTWECQDCGYIFESSSGGDEDDITFTKVTDASQIAVDNIGTCAVEDAKSWIIANWDVVNEGTAADIAFYLKTGELNVVQFFCGWDEEDFLNEFNDYINPDASISDLQDWFGIGDTVFICTAAAPAEDGPLVGTVIKVGDTLTLDGDYIEYIPGSSGQVTNSYILERMEYDDYSNGWGFIFESGAFLVAGDETPEPDGFYVSGGNGTQSHPYTLALHYASAATASFTKVTDASQITDENIGTCTADEAKAWILANWDDVNEDPVANIVFYSNTGELNVVLFSCGIEEEAILNDFDYYINTDTSISELQDWFDAGDSVFICTPAAPVTEWHIGDPINLGGKYYINDDQGAPSSYGFDRDVIVSEPVYETMYNQWIFENVIASNASEAYALYISLPTGKTASDVPTGFKVKSGDGTQGSPYTFELVYAEAVSFGKVTSADQITAENIEVCTFDDAKAWVLDNWDAIIADAGDVFAVEFAYTVNGNLRTIGFAPNITKDDFQDNITEVSCDINTLLLDYTLGGFPIYLCGFEGAATAYAGYVPAETDDANALAAKVVKFNGYDWYLIEDNSTAVDAGTVTLLAKECVGASKFGDNNTYSGSTLESYVNSYYADNFSAAAQAAVSEGLFILTREQAQTIHDTNVDVLKCSQADGADYNKWWLSSSGSNKFYAAYVYGDSGDVSNSGSLLTMYGVRPALNLDLSKVEFDSETKTFALPAAAVTEYPLWVGGVLVTSENMSGEGWNYAADTNTLTLNGYTNSGTARADIQSGVNNAAIYYNDNMFSPNPLTIQLAEGTTNSLTMTGDRVYGIYVFGSALTITGNGTLNVQSEEMAINDAWGVAITGGTVNAASSAYYGINSVTIGSDISAVTVTGKLGAIYGGSNEEQELINAVAGTGWTDTAGTTGKAAIAISTTGQNVSSYKKVYFTPHTHDFTYSANGATITATCTADNCTLTDSRATLTIVAPTLTVYGGTGSEKATLDGLDAFNAATGLNVDADSIVYWKAKIIEGVYKTDGNEPLAGAPTNAGNYLAKITVSNCIASVGYTIAKANITPTVSLEGWAYGATAKTPVVTGNSGNGAVSYTYAVKGGEDFSATVPTNAGAYTVKATVAATTNYNGGTATADFTIAKANITPTVSLEGWTYGQEPNAPSVSGNTGNGTVTYTYATKDSDNFSATVPTNAGNYTVKATIAATTNYNGKTVTADFTIAKADIAPTVSIEGWTYGQPANAPSVTGNNGDGTVTYTYATKNSDNFSATVPTNAGNYTVKATIAAKTNYNGGTATADFTIAKADIAPTVSIEGWTYGDEANTPSVTGNAGNGDVAYTYAQKGSDNFSATVPTNAGNYTVKATIAATTNYNGGTATADFTIAKADPTYTVPTGLTATYGDTLSTVTLPEGWAWVDGSQKVGNAGTNTFKATFTPENTDNYNVLENLDVTVTVNKADVNPTVTLSGWTYGDKANKPVVDGNHGNGTVTYLYKEKNASDMSCTEEVPTEAGEYTVKVLIGETDNYNGGEATVNFKIAKATIAPTVSIKGWTYGNKANAPAVSGNTGNGKVTYTYAAKGSNSFSAKVPTKAGSYTVKATIAETANYKGGTATANFTIAKAKITITAGNKTSKREAALKKLTYKVSGKIASGDDLGIKLSTNAKAAVAGKYTITVKYTANANYTVKTVNGKYTVTDRITASEKAKGKNKINSAIKATVNKTGSINVKWGAVENAGRFEIYANYCGTKNEYKLIKTVSGSTTSFDITKLGGKKLDLKKSVKVYVAAYRKVNGKYEKIVQSIALHVVGKEDAKSSNAKAINVTKSSYTLKANKAVTLKPTIVLEDNKKAAVEHTDKFRYQSTDTAVATVDENGKIKTVGKGSCTIYVFANNGIFKKVKITVK